MRSHRSRVALVVAGLAAAAGCGRLQGVPAGRGWTAYRVGSLTVELPEAWIARGDPVRFEARSPGSLAKVEVEQLPRPFASEAACLAAAEQSLSRGSTVLERPRQHPTRLGARAAWTMEADLRGWHGWAWAACDGGRQYRLSFFGASPLSPDDVTAQRGMEASVRFEAGP